MTTMLDLEPATRRLAGLLAGITDEQLSARSPCERYSLGDLIEHVDGLSLAFTAAATKQFPLGGSQAPSGDVARLRPDWRTRIPVQLRGLAEAWRDPGAWEGMTEAGGVELPASLAGVVALNELVVHGWDISRASGQPYAVDREAAEACMQFAAMSADQRGADSPFGPVVEVTDDAEPLDRLVGLTGRDPSWTPTG